MLSAIKWIILAIIAIALIIVGIANMTPVDLHLLPPAIGGYEYTFHQVPLAGVILVSMLIGIVIGEFIEWIREHKHRRTARVKKREASELARENEALKSKLEGDDDLPKIAAR